MSRTPEAANRPISRFVAGFAAASLVASLGPLITRPESEESLVPLLVRGESFVVYSGFLLLFAFFLLPQAVGREGGRGLGPWWVLAGLALLFGAIPAVTSAYISGIALGPALAVGGLVAGACALVLLLRAFLGAAARPLAFALGGLTLFAIPAIEALCWSTGTSLAAPVGHLSLIGWVRRLAHIREPVDPRPILGVASAMWLVVIGCAVREVRAVRRAALALLLVPVAMLLPTRGPDVTVTPLLGGAARAGLRIPVAITAKGGGSVDVRTRGGVIRVPADGRPHTALMVLAPAENEAEVSVAGAPQAGSVARIPLPFRWPDARAPIVGVIPASLKDPVRAALPGAEVVTPELAALPGVACALEICDAIVIEEAAWRGLGEPDRARLSAFAATLGTLWISGGAAAETRPVTARTRAIASPDALRGADLRRRLDPDAFDATLKGLFARPDWQALELSRLILFLVLYHAAFLVAFLLPLVLDSHKASAVYLVSVAAVMLLVVGLAWWSLKSFFLRDNQVYTQALTYVVVPRGGGESVARQFRCYASMSGEHRDFAWPAGRDLVEYRDGHHARVLDAAAGMLAGVWLDRFNSKLLVREDLVVVPPLALHADGDGYAIRPVAGVDDPLQLRTASIVQAAIIEADGTLRSAVIEGGTVRVGDRVDSAAAVDPIVRAIHGRFAPPASGRRVVARARGTRRLDDTTGYFKTADLDSVLVFDAE